MQERIIVLGAGIMQGPIFRIARELGLYTVAVDGSSTAPCIGMADQFEHIDLKDKEGIESLARSLRDSAGLAGIMTAGTDFSATVAWVAERLGLPGIPYETALNASDKDRMRACFKRAGIPSPEFTVIDIVDMLSDDTLKRLPLPAPFPLVVKPVDNMGSRGCRRVDIMEELQEAVTDSFRFSRAGRAIVEAFMEGPEFSVDAIVYHGEITICGLADRHIFFPPCFIEMGHTMPTAIAGEQQDALLTAFCDGVRALGIADGENTGAAKGDIKLTPQGPMIGEIAARLSGGYMSGWTYPYSSGVEPIRAAILAAIGRRPDGLAPQKTWTCAERAFISIPGTVKAMYGVKAVSGQAHIQDLFFLAAEGDKVSFPENNVSKCGNVISAAPDRSAAIIAAESAARSILIHLDPTDEETAAYLGSSQDDRPNGFPPDAFQLNPDLKAALSQLPETAPTPHSPLPTPLFLIPFPEFTASPLRDYVGRTVEESLQAVRDLTGLPLPEIAVKDAVKSAESSDNNKSLLGKPFWAALARGGYQGAVYYIDQLRGGN